MISAAEINHVKSHCPCGSPVEIDETIRVDGQLSAIVNGKWEPLNPRVIARFEMPIYFHEATLRGFCSAVCSLSWHELFWRSWQKHVGVA